MFKKCETLHSELFKNHNNIPLNKISDELFKDFYKEEKHEAKIKYYCKTHKVLLCALCISKIKTENDGKHAGCEIKLIDDIKKEFKDKINNLENKNQNFSDIIKDMSNMIDKIENKKEEIKIKIQKIFTEIL